MSPRLPFLALVGLVGGSVLVGSAEGPRPTLASAPRPVAGVTAPAARPTDAAGSTWYCAGGTAQDGGLADHQVVVANPTGHDATGVLTVFPGRLDLDGTTTAPSEPDGEPVEQPFTVPARSGATFRLADLRPAPVASALVELDRGGIAVEHQVTGPHGQDRTACASAAASTWNFAWGSTSRDAREVLVLFNPFASDVAVDASFATETGVREPLRWQGLIVPARSTLGVDVGQDVTRRDQVAVTLRARGGGRLIVDRLQVFDGSAGYQGLSVALGRPDPTEVSVFPDGRIGDQAGERIVLYNPASEPAEVDVTVQPPGTGDDTATTVPVQPVGVVVRPGRHEIVDYGPESRVARDVDHVTVVRSRNGVPVVAEQVRTTGSEASVAPGALFRATDWVFPMTTAPAGAGGGPPTTFMVVNPDPDHAAQVSFAVDTGGSRSRPRELQRLEVPAGGRLAVPLPPSIDGRPSSVLARSDRPVVVATTPGRPGIPVGDDLDPPL